MERLQIVVIGGGPVGKLLAAVIQQAGHLVVLVDSHESVVRDVADSGIRITGAMEIRTGGILTATSLGQLEDIQADAVILATKTTGNERLARDLRAILGKEPSIVLAQNGLDIEEPFFQEFGQGAVSRMVLRLGADRESDGSIRLNFLQPPSWIGGYTNRSRRAAQRLAAVFSEGGLETKFTTRLREVVWQKSALNAAVNSVSALTGRNIRQVLDGDDSRKLLENILHEAVSVARAEGVFFPDDFVATTLDYLATFGTHKPSMLQDAERKREMEIDALTGRVVRLGEIYGIRTPVNETVTKLLRKLERESISEIATESASETPVSDRKTVSSGLLSSEEAGPPPAAPLGCVCDGQCLYGGACLIS